jgi:hypothetical protein
MPERLREKSSWKLLVLREIADLRVVVVTAAEMSSCRILGIVSSGLDELTTTSTRGIYEPEQDRL